MTAGPLRAQSERITTGSMIRSASAVFLNVPKSHVGFFGGNSFNVVVYALGDRSLVDQGGWAEFARRVFPAWARVFLFISPPQINDASLLDHIARRVDCAASGTGRAQDEAAFALGGAQAVADLVLGEQRERQPAQRVLPA